MSCREEIKLLRQMGKGEESKRKRILKCEMMTAF